MIYHLRIPLKFRDEDIVRSLIIRIKNGDIHAYDEIYDRYCHKLFMFVFRILKNEADSQDIVQEVFIRLWEVRKELDTDKYLDYYIFTLAYNSSISLIRKRISSSRYIESMRLASVKQSADNPGTEAEYNELKLQVEKLIESLPVRQKQVFLSHRENGMTYSEIAHELGISENTVENHMVKALKYLRMHLKSFLPAIRIMITYFK